MLINYINNICRLFTNVLASLSFVLDRLRQANAVFMVLLVMLSYCLSTFCLYCFIFCYLIFSYSLFYFYVFFLNQYRKKAKTVRHVNFLSIFRHFKCLIISKTKLRQLRQK